MRSAVGAAVVRVVCTIGLATGFACPGPGSGGGPDQAPGDSRHTVVAVDGPFCGLSTGSTGECAGTLPEGWRRNMSGPDFRKLTAVLLERKLGFGRYQQRLPFVADHPKIPTYVAPLQDTHLIRPDKIGADVIFGVLVPIGNDDTKKEKKFKLSAADSAVYWLVLGPSKDMDKSDWSLVRSYFDRQARAWAFTVEFENGRWRTCTHPHLKANFAFADFVSCEDLGGFSPTFASELRSDVAVASALAPAINSLNRDGDEPVWIFCSAGCCEADQ